MYGITTSAQLFDIERASEEEITRDGEVYKDIYFSRYAAELFGRDDVWGLVAIPLGKKSNIKNFYFKVLNDLLYNGYVSNESIKERVGRYRQSRKNFKKQLAIVGEIQNEINQINLARQKMLQAESAYLDVCESNCQMIDEKNKAIEKLKEDIANHQESLLGLEKETKNMEGKIAQTKQKQGEVERGRAFLLEQTKELKEEKIELCGRISILTKIFKPKKYKVVMDEIAEKDKEIQKKKEEESVFQNESNTISRQIKLYEDKLWEMKDKQDVVLQIIYNTILHIIYNCFRDCPRCHITLFKPDYAH